MHDAETLKSGPRVSLLVFIVPGMGMKSSRATLVGPKL
jgi:hypothetical protein